MVDWSQLEFNIKPLAWIRKHSVHTDMFIKCSSVNIMVVGYIYLYKAIDSLFGVR